MLKKTTIRYASKLIADILKLKSTSVHSFLLIFALGVFAGVTFEENVGIGTWHSFHPNTDKVNLCFTPPSGCADLIAIQLAEAKKSIHVQAYGLTLPAIIYQLKQAHKRGVKVSVILDGGSLSNNKEIYQELKGSGIEVVSDKMSGIAHNKVMIIDNQKVITGSFNFTVRADKHNAENVVMIDDAKISSAYISNWQERYSQSERY